LYGAPDGHIVAVPFGTEREAFRTEQPQQWGEARFMRRRFYVSAGVGGSIDLHPDGARFAAAALPDSQSPAKQDTVVFVFNFFDDLARLAPPRD
jgi:hypothetical protein